MCALESVENVYKVESISHVRENVEEPLFVHMSAKRSVPLLALHVRRAAKLFARTISVRSDVVRFVYLVDAIVNGNASISSALAHVQNLVTDRAVMRRAKRFFQVFRSYYQIH